MVNPYTKLSMAIIFFLFSFDASAMECSPTPVDDLFKQSDLVFEAEVVKRKPVRKVEDALCSKYSRDEPTCGPKIADLKIREIWKGPRGEAKSLYSGDACYCLGSYLSKGETYIIFAKRAEPDESYGLIATPGCGSIRPAKFSTREKLEIRKLAGKPQ